MDNHYDGTKYVLRVYSTRRDIANGHLNFIRRKAAEKLIYPNVSAGEHYYTVRVKEGVRDIRMDECESEQQYMYRKNYREERIVEITVWIRQVEELHLVTPMFDKVTFPRTPFMGIVHCLKVAFRNMFRRRK